MLQQTLYKHLNLMPRNTNSGKSDIPVLNRGPPHLKMQSNATEDFKNFKLDITYDSK
jgi:hypothetical protein